MEFKDYYAILGVDPTADQKAIRAAYRKLARQYHPDVSKHKDAEAKFKEVSEAYEVLHKSDKRAEYDELREARRRGYRFEQANTGFSEEQFNTDRPGGFGPSDADFADFFNSIFGNRNTWQSSSGRSQNPRGRDLEIELPVFLEETLTSHVKTIEYLVPQQDQLGRVAEQKKSLKVTIPAGVNNGERIRVKGQGAPGTTADTAGDLYIHIQLVPHPLFDVEAHNLVITLPVSPWEAALGAKITLPTLSGRIQLTIPANSQSGQRLRIKGKGLIGRQGQGDLLAVLKVVMPQNNGETIKKLWQQLANSAEFDPRAEWKQYERNT